MNIERLNRAEAMLLAIVRRNVQRLSGGRPSTYVKRVKALRGHAHVAGLRDIIRTETEAAQ